MVAQPQELKNLDNNYDSLATQWFIVSDLGLTAFSGNDGIHVFVNSLATTEAKSGIEVRLISRGNEVLATRKTDAERARAVRSWALPAGRARPRRRSWLRPIRRAISPSSICEAPAFDLTDRGVAGRPAPNGLDAFVYAERGVYRSGETVNLTALLRDAQGAAALNVPLTLVVERPDGVEFKRALVPDQGLGGHALTLPIGASAPTGTWHVQRLHRSETPGGRRNDLPGRGLCARPDRVRSELADRPHFAKAFPPRSMSPAASSTARRPRISISKAR